MSKPIILALDDDPHVLRAVERDLRTEYGAEYRIARADSGHSALELLTGWQAVRNDANAACARRIRAANGPSRGAWTGISWIHCSGDRPGRSRGSSERNGLCRRPHRSSRDSASRGRVDGIVSAGLTILIP